MNGLRARGVSNGTATGDTVADRAALFEDEKRRIIESCFTKREPDGAFAESYITHIRVTEDAGCPSTPPPPDSASENKKSRAIIVAVKRSGRVRLHKARENPQGTFSIGKTWVLDDLTAIDSWTGVIPTTHDEQQRKDWAGSTGVLLTIGKPYFWQIATQKEKDFFVGSLIKIYRKYTKGREPRLGGFTSKELSDFGVTGQPPPLIAAQRSPAPAEPSPYASPSPAPSPFVERSRNRELRPPSSDSNNTIPSGYVRSSGTTFRGDDASSRFQEMRNVSNASSIKEEARPPTDREESVTSKFTFNSSKESLPQDTPGSSISNEKPKVNGSFSTFSRNRDGPVVGRTSESPRRVPSTEQGFDARPKSPERRSGYASRVVSESSDAREALPERRRPPIASGSSTPFSSTNTQAPPLVTADSTEHLKANLGSGPSVNDKSKDSPMNGSLNGDTTQSEFVRLRNISEALSPVSPLDSVVSPLSPPPLPEEHRPGLGPMIRKKKSAKEIADTFRKAASTVNGFKPRIGGAADRLLREGLIAKSSDGVGGDGITGVFVARPKDTLKSAEPTPTTNGPRSHLGTTSLAKDDKDGSASPATVLDKDRLSVNLTPEPLSISTAAEKSTRVESTKEVPEKRKPLPDRSAHYAKIFGCDPVLLEGRTAEVDGVLDDFGWTSTFVDGASRKTVEELQTDIKRDIAKLESGSWLSVMETGDDRVAQISKLIDDALRECDELDGLLTLYNVELGTLAEDVAYIEAQSQGLQVQTANQRLLQTELQSLLDTIAIPERQLEILERSNHDSQNFIQEIGGALVQLYKAMITIDPSIKTSEDKDATNRINADVSNMRAVRDQKDKYSRASLAFAQTFNENMVWKFRSGQQSIKSVLQSQKMQFLAGEKIDHSIRSRWREELLYYSPIILFEREVRKEEHEDLLQRYAQLAADPYREQFRAVVQAWQRDTKTASGSEEILFTSQEKEPEGMTRKLTVKRSKTVLKAEGPKGLGIDRDQGGKLEAHRAFSGALLDLSRAILLEQNFVTEFFHLHSGQDADFPELIEKASSGAHTHTDLIVSRGYESNRDIAKQTKYIVGQIFPDWDRTLRSTIDQVISDDILNSFGVLFSIQDRASSLSSTSQEFLTSSLAQVEEYVSKKIRDLIKDQVKAIDDQKVRLKKRKGVLSFIKIFPLFVKSIEAQLPNGLSPETKIRKVIAEHYTYINSHIFQSLKAIAKDSGISGMGSHKPQGLQGATDAEDKEILNYHILLIENTHHYIEDVPDIPDEAIQAGRDIARKEMEEHLGLYVSVVLRRPLGKLLDFIESTENLVKTANGGTASIADRASHSKSVFKRILSSYDSKEITKGIDALKKRVNKHFAEADEAIISQTLVAKVLTACKDRYEDVHKRTTTIVNEVYDGSLEIEVKREDIQAAFKRV